MSYKQKSRGLPNVQTINLDNNKKIPPKPCSEETNDYVSKLVSGKLDRIEEIINNFDKNLSNQSTAEFFKFNAKFTLNNVPCELEYDLSNFNFENLQKLAILTTQVCNVQKSRGLPYVQKSRGPYMQKINLDNNKRIRRKPPKLCSDCKETNDCVLKLVSG